MKPHEERHEWMNKQMKVKNNEKILEMEDNITRQKENRLSVY
jgi:hypothetical protein